LIDNLQSFLLKLGKGFAFVGMNYFNKEVIGESDNETIGVILASEKDDIFVEYATASVTNKLAVGEYQLYLPNKKELENKVKDILNKE